jgi:thioredoxin-related protein
MMIKKTILFTFVTFFVLVFSGSYANNNEKKINWMTIEEALKANETNPKKIFIDIYTDWCGWCKRLDANTFSNAQIIDYVNKNFHPVKLNAEQSEPIVFRGVTYENPRPGQSRSAHNFAIAITQGRLSYPSLAFMDENLNLITAVPGFKTPQQLEPWLAYITQEVYKTNPNFNEFSESFKGSISE